jgi:hypothetical protein
MEELSKAELPYQLPLPPPFDLPVVDEAVDSDIVSPVGQPVSTLDSDDWQTIADRLVDELTSQDLPDKVVQAAEMMLAGYPLYQVARKVNVTTPTVRRWLSAYPMLAAVVANGRKLLSKWRLARLEQQFLTALERSQEVLEIPLDGETSDGKRVNPKILTVVAAQARYIIGLFAGQQQNITVTHEMGDTVMQAREDALAYLAQKLAEQRQHARIEPVEAVYRVIDPKLDNNGPMLDEQGHPSFGEIGKLDIADEGTLCHVCGGRYKSFARHLLTNHNLSAEEYESLYLLPEGSIRDRP